MSGEIMEFPKTLDEFMEQYKIVDTEQVYTNGVELVPIFRIKQWEDAHKPKKGKWLDSQYRIAVAGTCSCCGWKAILFETDVAGMPFCPNCGADMRDEDDNIPMEYFENGGI